MLSCSVSGYQFSLNRSFQGERQNNRHHDCKRCNHSPNNVICKLQRWQIRFGLPFGPPQCSTIARLRHDAVRNLVHWLKKLFGRCEVTLVSVQCCSCCDQRGTRDCLCGEGRSQGSHLLWVSFLLFSNLLSQIVKARCSIFGKPSTSRAAFTNRSKRTW